MKGSVLVVDDEIDIQDLLCFILQDAGYDARSTGRGDQALAICRDWNPDLVILDIGLPGISGLKVCPLLVELSIPVLVLSSHDRDDQVVEGLEVGAEDYVSKPFNHKELLLRVEKIIRRTKGRTAEESTIISLGEISIDLMHGAVSVHGGLVQLTPTEFKILTLLASSPGTPMTPEMLLHEVWRSDDWINGTEMVKVNISRLRKKIEADPSNPKHLLNIWGQGYCLVG